MRRKGFIFLGIVTFLFVMLSLQSCKSHPEKGLLERYFHAVSLKDTATMSKMAVEPTSLDIQTWEIVNVGEEKVDPATLPDLNQKEMELKKNLEGHVGPVMDAEDALYGAQEELKAARTSAAKAAAKKKVDEMQAKFDEERELHRQLQKQYNEAKAAAQKEQEISLFSLDAGEIPNIRDLTGTVHSKEVDVRVVGKDGQAKTYRFYLKKYELKDETINLSRRGRWIISKMEPIG